MSTNSDPNEGSSSLLARISAKRTQEGSPNSLATPVDSPSTFQFTRPPTGSLRVDTTVSDGSSMKQNKSAYPTFASNGILMQAPERIRAKSPAPVTAGPDLGRHNSSRLEIVGYNVSSLSDYHFLSCWLTKLFSGSRRTPLLPITTLEAR